MLKILEDPPKHVWFLLCTSSKEGLLPTFTGRCFQVELKTLDDQSLIAIVLSATKKLEKKVTSKVIRLIVEKANGSARKALYLLEGVLTQESEEDQIATIGPLDSSEKVDFVAVSILKAAGWETLSKAIQAIDSKDVEGIRYQVLAYMDKVLTGGSGANTKRIAYLTICAFRDSWSNCGRAGLSQACYEVWSKYSASSAK
jgi:DNA polymerase-3 subunit gamma/tau